MPSIFRKNTTGWVEIKSVFRKNTTGWIEILNAYRKNSAGWIKVFQRTQIPGIIVTPKVRNSNGDDINNSTIIARVGDTLYGYQGSWSNSPTVYEDRWYFNQYVGGGSYNPFSPAQINSTLATTLAMDGYYIVYQVRATNSAGTSDYVTSSNEARVVKYSPVSLLPYTLSGSPTVGSTLIAAPQGGSWKSTTNISGDTSPDSFQYEWSWSTGEIIQSTSHNAINSLSYVIQSTDNGKQIRFRSTGTNTGGSATSGYTTSATVTTPYSFAFGNTLYVGSNGYITLDQAPSYAIAALPAGNGRTINIYNEDLVQYSLQEYSDNSTYYLYFKSYRYLNPPVPSSINALDYQIKFYTGQQYCDVYLVRRGSSVPAFINNPGFYSNGLFQTLGFSGSWTTGSVARIFFTTSAATSSGIPWTAVPDNVWKNITTSQIDDSYTAVVTSANQQAPVLTAPTITSVTVGNQGGPVTVNYTGGSGPFYQAYWYGTATAPNVQVTPDASGSSSSSLTDYTGPSSTATQYMYVRSVLTQAEASVGPSSLASNWSAGVQFNMISTAVTQNTAPSATATSNGSTTTVKYLDSITWAAGTYNNAASITSVLLYSTNTANLVSPGGNTNSSFRSTSPYTIQTSDPAGTPYVFAVRDTVVGINGTTYYFYSNQITSANADAVAFSYNTGVGAAGGWSASVVTGQSGASYSITTTTGYSVNSSTGAVTVTGLGSNVYSSIIVTKSVVGYSNTTATASGTSSTVASPPTSPTGLSVSAGAVSGTLGTTLTRNSATNKTQSWSTATSQSATVFWTKGTGTGTITSDVKWNQSGATPGSGDSGTWNGVSGSSQADTNGGGSTNYYWVRTSDGNGLKSAWVYAGSYTAASPSMSGLVIRIYRGSGSSFSTGSASSTSTSGSYTYSNLTNRDASPDFGHYAYASGTLNGTAKTATSSTV